MRVIERIKDFFTLHLRRNKMCKWLRKASSRPRRRSSSKESRDWLSVLVFLITYGPTPRVNWRFAKIDLTKRTLHKFVASQMYVPLLVLIKISCALYLRYPSKDYIMIKIPVIPFFDILLTDHHKRLKSLLMHWRINWRLAWLGPIYVLASILKNYLNLDSRVSFLKTLVVTRYNLPQG